MGDFLHDFSSAEGAKKSDQDLIAVKERDILFAGNIVRSVAKDLHYDVGRGEYRLAIGDDLRALVGILGVGIPSFDSCPGLHVNFETSFGKCRENRGHESNPPLSWINLFRNTDYQESLPVPRFWTSAPEPHAPSTSAFAVLMENSGF